MLCVHKSAFPQIPLHTHPIELRYSNIGRIYENVVLGRGWVITPLGCIVYCMCSRYTALQTPGAITGSS